MISLQNATKPIEWTISWRWLNSGVAGLQSVDSGRTTTTYSQVEARSLSSICVQLNSFEHGVLFFSSWFIRFNLKQRQEGEGKSSLWLYYYFSLLRKVFKGNTHILVKEKNEIKSMLFSWHFQNDDFVRCSKWWIALSSIVHVLSGIWGKFLALSFQPL